jgi:3-hydroxyisobutyrate dehydrogenase
MKKPTLAWIGTGIMGRSMAMHLLKGGYALNVFTRTKSKAEDLIQSGATWCASPHEAAERSDIVFLMLGYPHEVRETINTILYCPHPSPLPEGEGTKKVIVDMTTSSPSLAVEIADQCRKQSIIALDAPVSGGDIGARNATLSIMIGGDEKAANDLMPIWNLLGKTIVYHGSAGSGQHAKMVNQTLIAGNMLGLCEALVYAHRAGLDMDRVLQSVSSGAAGSWSLTNLAPRILKQDFAPGFMIEHFLKDLRIVLEESRRMNLTLRGVALAEELYTAAVEQGYAQDGTQGLYRLLNISDCSGAS